MRAATGQQRISRAVCRPSAKAENGGTVATLAANDRGREAATFGRFDSNTSFSPGAGRFAVALASAATVGELGSLQLDLDQELDLKTLAPSDG